MNRRHLPAAILLGAALSAAPAWAEPHLAVRAGVHCSTCHVNRTGGGLRTPFGVRYGVDALPAAGTGAAGDWDGRVAPRLRLGGDARAALRAGFVPNRAESYAFEFDEALLYAEIELLPARMSVYIDQRVAPGTATNREAYALYRGAAADWHLKAGRMFVPFGLRFEDDTAFVRQVSGVTMATPDDGVELGWESGALALQVAVGNGAAGGAETDKGKQWSASATYVRSRWRIGASANLNDGAGDQDRRMVAAYAGLRTGPVVWLAEVDRILDDTFPAGRREQWLGLLEANWAVAPGHNVRLTTEYYDPDDGVAEDEQGRASAIWEYTLMPFTQVRLGYRVARGIPQSDLQNRKDAFLQLHVYF